MHLARGVLARGALRRRPLRAAWPRIFDARHRRGGLRWSLLVPTWFALGLSIAAAVAIFRFKVGMIPTLAACCIAGMLLYLLGATS